MKDKILFQLDMVWQLFQYHCEDLKEPETDWCRTQDGLQVRKKEAVWIPDWPETEEYTIGPASIGWTLWHILYWWKNALSTAMGGRVLDRNEILWPGNSAAAIREIRDCHDKWVDFLLSLEEAEFQSDRLCRWPFEGRSFAEVALWLNMEFMKNTAEIGTARFLYAVSEQ